MHETLKNCPFCGAAAHFEMDEGRWEWVECESCGMQGNRSASLMEDCKPKLAEEWNRRTPQPTQAQAEKCAVCGDGNARLLVMRSCDVCGSDYAGQSESEVNVVIERARKATQAQAGAVPRDVTPPEDAMLRNAARRSSKLIAKGGQHGAE